MILLVLGSSDPDVAQNQQTYLELNQFMVLFDKP
jgi:hypothetical protein